MGDLKTRLLPPRPQAGEATRAPSTGVRPLFQGVDGKKRGQNVRSWIKISTSGENEVIEVDKATVMKRCDLPARDLRLLDPLFVYPSTILGRDKAIVVNLEQIRCIITADEVLLLNSLDNYVRQYVTELERRLATKNHSDVPGFKWRSPGGQPVLSGATTHNSVDLADSLPQELRHRVLSVSDMFSGSSADDLPFEFRALEVALEAACTFLDTQATELEQEAYPVLDELTSKISTLNLERVRRLKSRLVALTRRVQKVRDEIEQLMDDDGDMADMYLTEKKERTKEHLWSSSTAVVGSVSAPVSPRAGSRGLDRNLERTLSLGRSRHENSSDSGNERVEELEMLLEAYFVVIDGTLNKLTSLKEYIDDTEDFINIQLDNVRNQLIQFELLLTTATFVVAICGVVAGVFGMNIPVWIFEEPRAFKWVLIITGSVGILVFLLFLWFFKRRRLLPI